MLAVPSDDFNQKLAFNAKVKQFFDLNDALTLPVTKIEHVAGGDLRQLFG